MENKKIFIALNNFEHPNLTANYGIHLAKSLSKQAQLFGLAKVPVLTPSVSLTGTGVENPIPREMQTIKVRTDQSLAQLSLNLKKIYPNVVYETTIGFAEETIIEQTKEETPFCVVIERVNDLSTLHEWFGTYATRLAENIEVPVLVLPKSQAWSKPNNILYVMNLDDHKISNIRFLSTIAKALSASLSIVVVNNQVSAEEQKKYNFVVNTLQSLLGYNQLNFHQVFAEESATLVSQLIETARADWLAFEHKSQSFLDNILNDYNTKRLILRSDYPVLVF